MYAEALQAQARIDDPQYAQRILSLQAAIKYEQDDMAHHLCAEFGIDLIQCALD